MKSRLEILDETVEYYNSHKRASDNGKCSYMNSEGYMCSVGRIMTKHYLKKYKHNTTHIRSLAGVDRIILNSIVKPDYRGHSIDFWMKLQAFHDREMYWIEKGNGHVLTTTGRVYYNEMKNWYKN